jgi:flagellar biosynthesis/type III secretory pathway protein FliH
MAQPRNGPGNAFSAVNWSPDELELVGEAFGGPPVNRPAAPPSEALHLQQQQALDEAFTQGFDAGRTAGAEAERARLAGSVAAATLLLDELREREKRWTERIEENICALAVAVGRQLFDREMEFAPAHAGDLVRRALAEFPIDQPVSIRVNPSDLASITAHAVAEGGQATLGRLEAQWIPDPRIASGGCVVEGRDRIIDGRVDTALERLYRRLTATGA